MYEFPKPDPEHPGPPQTLELRVHGVSGTPPQDLLDRPLVDQVAGDKIAGFYRPRLQAERYDDRPSSLRAGPPRRPVARGLQLGRPDVRLAGPRAVAAAAAVHARQHRPARPAAAARQLVDHRRDLVPRPGCWPCC